MERKKQSSPFAPSSFSSSGAGRTGYIATAQLGPMQQNFSHRGKTFSANAIAQSEAIAQSVLICSERSIHPANPARGSSLSRRLAQVFCSDVPYRAVSFRWDLCFSFHSLRIFISSGDGVHGSLSLFHRFILTRHFALQVVLRPCGTLSQNGSLHLRIVTKGSTFTVMLKSIL